ncbi:MAG: peptidase and chymotrypsin/Hap [Streptosporangiaceae bacterium]|nr:peptidase and chymotrypsin/Hap [Streptosporangiaceae bacterium]
MPEEEPVRGSRRVGAIVQAWAPVVGSLLASAVAGVLVEKLYGAVGAPNLLRVLGWAVVAAFVVFVLTRAPVRQAFGTLRARWETPVEFTLLVGIFAVGVLAARLLVPLGTEAWRRVAYEPCAGRIELRVMTAPETRAAFQRLGAQFSDAQARSQHCRPVRVNVSAASSLSDLESAFQSDWAGLAFDKGSAGSGSTVLGPQPDIWIPPSTATVEYLRSKGIRNLASAGSLATSPLVIAVSDAQLSARIGAQTGQSLAEIVTAVARAPQLPLARPNPETSEVGLLSTMELYGRDPHPSAEQRRTDEKLMAQAILPTGNSVDLLCALRTAKQTTPDVAALVPEHVLYDYNAGRSLGDGCPTQQPALKLYAVYPQDVDAFDYPFVRVSWPGQGGWARDRMVGEFRDWLSPRRLRAEGLRDTSGAAGPLAGAEPTPLAARREFVAQWRAPRKPPSGSELATALKQFRQARTAVSVLFVVDVSGSMGEAISIQGSRLDRARTLLRTALKLLGSEESGDYAALVTFPAAGDPVPTGDPPVPRPAKGSALSELTARVDRLIAAEGSSSPLYQTVGQAVDRLSGPPGSPLTSAVVVLTDGGDSVRQGTDAAAPAKSPEPKFSAQWRDDLIAKLTKGGGDPVRPHVLFLTIGAPGWCEGTDARLLKRTPAGAARAPVSCQDATTLDREQLLTQVIGELRKG